MDLLFSLDNYDHGTGGAEASAQTLAHWLAAQGHRVQVLQEGHDLAAYQDGLVRVHTRRVPRPRFLRARDRDTLRWNRRWRPMLEAFLAEHPTDLIFTQNRLLQSTVAVAGRSNIPVVVFVRGYAMFCPIQFRNIDPLKECDRDCGRCLPWHFRLRYGATQQNREAYEMAIRAADLVIANSHFVREVIRRFYSIEAEVVHPPVDLNAYVTNRAPPRRRGVLFVKPQHVKGLPIFLRIAERMPEVPFLVAGRARSRVRRKLCRLRNVEYLGWLPDMRVAYQRARVLLGPSIWPEPFGRIFVEAGANGIPSVASARGGIPESIGEGGILVDDIFDMERWVEALRRFDDPETYAGYATRARTHASKFATERQVERLAEAVHQKTGLEL